MKFNPRIPSLKSDMGSEVQTSYAPVVDPDGERQVLVSIFMHQILFFNIKFWLKIG